MEQALDVYAPSIFHNRLEFEGTPTRDGPKLEPIMLTTEENNRLVGWTRRHKTSVGTALQLAALTIATGRLIGEIHCRHRAKEFLAFLRAMDEPTPAQRDVHLLLVLRHSQNPFGESPDGSPSTFPCAVQPDLLLVA